MTKAAGAVLAHDVAVAPGVVDPAQQEGEAAAAMGEAELERAECARRRRTGSATGCRAGSRRAWPPARQHPSSASCGRRSSCPRMHQHRMPSSAQCTRKFTSVSSSRSRGPTWLPICTPRWPAARAREASGRPGPGPAAHLGQRFQAVGRVGAVLQRQVRCARPSPPRPGRIGIAEHHRRGAQDLQVDPVAVHLRHAQRGSHSVASTGRNGRSPAMIWPVEPSPSRRSQGASTGSSAAASAA